MAMAVNMALMALSKVISISQDNKFFLYLSIPPSLSSIPLSRTHTHKHTLSPRSIFRHISFSLGASALFVHLVNQAGIFCTEPYRVPLAGKVSHCLFDKTGTITTDQLVPVGIVRPVDPAFETTSPAGAGSVASLSDVSSAVDDTAMVLAACHSLVVVEDPAAASSTDDDAAPSDAPSDSNANPSEGSSTSAVVETAPAPTASPKHSLVGDPIELAAMNSVGWSWDAETSTASPGSWRLHSQALDVVRTKIAEMRATPPAQRAPQHETILNAMLSDAVLLESKIIDAKRKAASAPYKAVTVVQRYHFSSQLQRMSVLCKCVKTESGSSADADWHCLVKGSPEAVKTLLAPGALPSWYESTYESLARRGLRVLALAHKKIGASEVDASLSLKDQPRSWVESNLTFSGFIAFECKIRADSRIVIKSLLQSDHKVSMLTGDALLTSLHVARQVDICDKQRPTLTLTSASASSGAHWVRRSVEGEDSTVPFAVGEVAKLAEASDLLTTEADLLAVIEATGDKESPLWKNVGHFKVRHVQF